MVATYLNVNTNVVIDGVADAKAHVDLLESFLTAGGRQAVLFYYQDGAAYEIGWEKQILLISFCKYFCSRIWPIQCCRSRDFSY